MSDKLPPHVRIGVPPRAASEPGAGKGKGIFWSCPADEAVQAHVLVSKGEIVSIDQVALWNYLNPSPVWTYIGDEDPSHDLGVKPGYRAFLPVIVKIDGESKVKLWSMSVSCHRLVVDADDAVGGLKGHVVNIKRTGKGKGTKYSVIPIGKKIKVTTDVPTHEEILALLGPYDRDAIIELIEKVSAKSFSDVVQEVQAKVATSGKGEKPDYGKKKPGKIAVVEEITLDDDDAVEDVDSTDDGEF